MARLNILMVAVLATLVIGGCATATPTYDASGKTAHVIKCDGSAGLSWGDCYVKAGEVCGSRGYTEISKDTTRQTTTSAGFWRLFSSQYAQQSLLIRCNWDCLIPLSCHLPFPSSPWRNWCYCPASLVDRIIWFSPATTDTFLLWGFPHWACHRMQREVRIVLRCQHSVSTPVRTS